VGRRGADGQGLADGQLAERGGQPPDGQGRGGPRARAEPRRGPPGRPSAASGQRPRRRPAPRWSSWPRAAVVDAAPRARQLAERGPPARRSAARGQGLADGQLAERGGPPPDGQGRGGPCARAEPRRGATSSRRATSSPNAVPGPGGLAEQLALRWSSWPRAAVVERGAEGHQHSGHVADRRKTAQPFRLSGQVLDRTPQRG
jgi:hypothetical protein